MSCSKRASAKRNHCRVMHSPHLGAVRELLSELDHAFDGAVDVARSRRAHPCRVHGLSAVGLAIATELVVVLEGEADRIDEPVTTGARRFDLVLPEALSGRDAFVDLRGLRHVGRRRR